MLEYCEDPFIRKNSSEFLINNYVKDHLESADNLPVPASIIEAFSHVLSDKNGDPLLTCQVLNIPPLSVLTELCHKIDFDALHTIRSFIEKEIAKALFDDFSNLYAKTKATGNYVYNIKEMSKRSLNHLALKMMIVKLKDDKNEDKAADLVRDHYKKSDNMTAKLCALTLAVHYDLLCKEELLKEFEDNILNAKDKIVNLEYELFNELKNYVSEYIISLQYLASLLASLDCYLSLAILASNNNYVRPNFNSKEITIINGRHPVLESILKDKYVPNDVYINDYDLLLLTGPNMGGKSTYMKMLAIIIIMAQMGSLVPSSKCELKIFDEIFTRIGASDDLVGGESTFMIEMKEANFAISNATNNSLILFDEIGRGTATYDGMALAQAIIEYIHQKVKAVTVFSTHYHELTSLEGKLKRLKNIHVDATEENDKVFNFKSERNFNKFRKTE